MDIQIKADQFSNLDDLKDPQKEPEEVAQAFEEIFTRHLVRQMTKGLFENDDNNTMMIGGSGLYRRHIVNTLASELAKEGELGISELVLQYIDQKNG